MEKMGPAAFRTPPTTDKLDDQIPPFPLSMENTLSMEITLYQAEVSDTSFEQYTASPPTLSDSETTLVRLNYPIEESCFSPQSRTLFAEQRP